MRRLIAACLLLTLILSGCQGAVMVGKVLFGDPLVPSAFEASTDIRLDKQELPVYVVCTSPSITTSKYETLVVDLPDELKRRLKRQGVKTGDAADAMNAAVDFSGRIDIRKIGRELDSGYLVHVDFERFSLTEDNGNTLYRGRAAGTVSVLGIFAPGSNETEDGDGDSSESESSESELLESDSETIESGETVVTELFSRGFEVTYPGSHPVPIDQTPEKVFRQRFINHLADETGRMVYRYRVSDTL